MGRIIYLPFENLPQRYTAMWNYAIEKNLRPEDIVVRVDNSEQTITSGEFLDTFGTIRYKARQIEKVAELFAQGAVKDGDTFYVPDIFYPGLPALRYMAELSGVKILLAAFNHAGRADSSDFVQRLGSWADRQEGEWHRQCDLVMAGSEFHARRVEDKFRVPVAVTGAVWDKGWIDNLCASIPKHQKEKNTIIWPHRPCDEKRYDFFLEVAKNNPKLRFIITSGGPCRIDVKTLPDNVEYRYGLTKLQYYEIFSRSEGYLSTAFQETFGYTVQEAIYFGCKIICPDYACYREYVAAESIVNFDDMIKPGYVTKLMQSEVRNLKLSKQFNDNAKHIVQLIRSI